MAQDFGMRLANVVLVGFEPGPAFVPDQAEIFGSALERLRAMPGVELATRIQSVPFSGFTCRRSGCPAWPSRQASTASCPS